MSRLFGIVLMALAFSCGATTDAAVWQPKTVENTPPVCGCELMWKGESYGCLTPAECVKIGAWVDRIALELMRLEQNACSL